MFPRGFSRLLYRVTGMALVWTVVVGCGPKADEKGEETCASCATDEKSYKCLLGIDGSLVDLNKVVCAANAERR